MEVEDDILMFCYSLANANPKDKLNYANGLLQDIEKMGKFVQKLMDSDSNNLLSDQFFLQALAFGVEYLRIPFILCLESAEFRSLIEFKSKRIKREEKLFLKGVFEKMFEKFLDFENATLNLENLEILCGLYSEMFEQVDANRFCKDRQDRSKKIQNDFERLYNSMKTRLNNASAKIDGDMGLEEAQQIMDLLNKIKINIDNGKNSGERSLLKQMIEQKDNLICVVRSFLPPDLEIEKKPKEEIKKGVECYIIEDEEEDEKKPTKKTKKEKLMPQKILKLEEFTSFVFNSHLPFLEDQEIEFKYYYFPLDEKHKGILRKTICAFLNTNGGRIYIGIRDQDQCVLGLELTTTDMDHIVLAIDNMITNEITPRPASDECVTKFVPVKNSSDNEYMPGCFVVKITVKRGKLNDLYFTKDCLTYERRAGKNQILEPSQFKQLVISRSKLPEDKNQENIEYNKRFADPDPEFGIRTQIKLDNQAKKKHYQMLQLQKQKSKIKKPNNINMNPQLFPQAPASLPKKPFVQHEFKNKPEIKTHVIFVGTGLNNIVYFEQIFLPNLIIQLKEMLFITQIKRMVMNKEKNKLFVESFNYEEAVNLHEIIKGICLPNILVDWAIMEKYFQILGNGNFIEIHF